MSSRHDTYGVLPEKVISGRVDGLEPSEIGAPLLTTSKCGEGLVTSRDTRIWLTPLASFSSQVTQGAVGLAGFIVPAAMRGSAASLIGFLFSEQLPSDVASAAQVLPL